MIAKCIDNNGMLPLILESLTSIPVWLNIADENVVGQRSGIRTSRPSVGFCSRQLLYWMKLMHQRRDRIPEHFVDFPRAILNNVFRWVLKLKQHQTL